MSHDALTDEQLAEALRCLGESFGAYLGELFGSEAGKAVIRVGLLGDEGKPVSGFMFHAEIYYRGREPEGVTNVQAH